RDAEPYRAGGYIPVAGGAARPFHARASHRLPVARGRRTYRDGDHGCIVRGGPAGAGRGVAACDAAAGPAGPGGAVAGEVCGGAGPHAAQYLVLGAKARAALEGRGVPNFDDVRAVAPSVLRHRVVTGFQAEADGRTPGDIVEELLQLRRKWT